MNKSAVISRNQLTLDFEPGLADRYQSIREVVATGVYKRGLGSVAIDLDQAPGNLSVQLSGDNTRHFSVDSLERYMEKTGDFTPIYYQIEKFLADKTASKDAATAEALVALKQLAPMLKKAGLI
jgi:hypothetical protein